MHLPAPRRAARWPPVCIVPAARSCCRSVNQQTPGPERRILARYGMAGATLTRLGHGLINRTFLAEDESGRRSVLQALNPIFPPGINDDIDRVTGHLAARGLTTPRLLRTLDGAAWVERHGTIWRMLSWVPGTSLEALWNERQAHAAGVLLARFHDALGDYRYPFSNPRLGVHDTRRHLAALVLVALDHSEYAFHDLAVFALVETLAN